MNPIDYLLLFIVLLATAAAIFAIVRSKKKGRACVGCPYSGNCANSCHCQKDLG